MRFSSVLQVAFAVVVISASPAPKTPSAAPVVNQTTCNGNTYAYNALAGYGFVPSAARDKFGDTIGGIGSSIALDKLAWTKTKSGVYKGILWALPDRGWNTEGTLNFQNRVHKFAINLTPQPNATVADPASPNLQLQYLDTVLLTDPLGKPVTGLDADVTGYISYPGFPILPAATYTGDGFGGAGTGGHRISLDTEGLVLNLDGSFWISDEYGPFVYRFSPLGCMQVAIVPPEAYLPRRNGSLSFSADSPPFYNPNEVIDPENNGVGRDNNQGLEGLTVSPDGRKLFTLIQSALNQEGGLVGNPDRQNARLLEYDITIPLLPKYVAEYVVSLPLYASSKTKFKVAAQSEIHALTSTQFLVLSRDSSAGRGQSSSTSLYRHVDVFDISKATNIKSGSNDAINGSIASSTGVLDAGITAAQYCSFLDYNVNSQLNRFGLHNGGAQDAGLLNEKWESLATVPVNPGVNDGEYFLFSLSDNDFITQNGYLNFGKFQYADESGFNLDNQALVFQISVPLSVKPS
ncbi:hypothetical protein MMC25_003638 [Agyrium rufum]|nr:hypothetical protein [Agyrium rufum]